MSGLGRALHRLLSTPAVRALALCFLVLCQSFTPADATTTVGPPAFGQSGLDGAGFQNVVAIDPFGSGVTIAGGDVAGFHRSTDYGKTWQTSNAGLEAIERMRVAALLFSPVERGTVYAAAGGLLVSRDYGQTWSLLSNLPFNAGNTTVPTLPNPHPRSTGSLLAMDPASRTLFAGTFGGGVKRSTDGGST